MLTYWVWEEYKATKTKMSILPPYNYLYTEEEVAKEFLIRVIITPFSLAGDILTLPFQLIYLISTKLIAYRIKRQRWICGRNYKNIERRGE